MSVQSKKKLSYTEREIHRHMLIADFLQTHCDLIESLSYGAMSEKLGIDSWQDTPHVTFWTGESTISFQVRGPEMRDMMRVLRKAFGGQWEKGGYGNTFEISRNYPNDKEVHIEIEISGPRDEVCQKVVTGTHERVVPAQPAVEEHIETVEDVEWVCGNLLTD